MYQNDIEVGRHRVGTPWTRKDEETLMLMADAFEPLWVVCNELGRNENGIIARAKILEQRGNIGTRELNSLVSQWDGFKDIVYDSNIVVNINTPTKDEFMSNKSGKTWTMVSMLQEDVMTIKIVFDTSPDKLYTYKTRDKTIVVDDYVVVNPGATEGRFNVGRVHSIDEVPDFDPESRLRYHWIVGKVDATEYNELVAMDERAYEMLINAEKHVARKKLMDMYTEALNLPNAEELVKLLQGKKDEDTV